jgi:hypothetical protein
MKTKEMQVPDSNEELQSNLSIIRSILGDNVNVEKVKQCLHGADNNLEVALNHLFASLEKEEQCMWQQLLLFLVYVFRARPKHECAFIGESTR